MIQSIEDALNRAQVEDEQERRLIAERQSPARPTRAVSAGNAAGEFRRPAASRGFAAGQLQRPAGSGRVPDACASTWR